MEHERCIDLPNDHIHEGVVQGQDPLRVVGILGFGICLFGFATRSLFVIRRDGRAFEGILVLRGGLGTLLGAPLSSLHTLFGVLGILFWLCLVFAFFGLSICKNSKVNQ